MMNSNWVYMIGFASGITKVGVTGNPCSRIKVHYRHFNEPAVWTHLIPLISRGEAELLERKLTRRLAAIGTCHGKSREVFRDLSKETVIGEARLIVLNRLEEIRKTADDEIMWEKIAFAWRQFKTVFLEANPGARFNDDENEFEEFDTVKRIKDHAPNDPAFGAVQRLADQLGVK